MEENVLIIFPAEIQYMVRIDQFLTASERST